MNELRWQTGERCREGDAVQWPGCKSIHYECTAIGKEKVMLKADGGEEFGLLSNEYVLLHRTGEAEDRDRDRYEYHEGALPAFYDRWEAIAGGDTLQFRRLRQPPAPLAFDPGFAPPGYVAKPAPGMPCVGCCFYGTSEQCPDGAEGRMTCIGSKRPDGQEAIFVKADPPAPAFDAVVCEVGVDPLDGGVTVLFDQHTVPAIVGQGHDGYTIAAFCESESEAQGCVDYYRTKGELPSDIGWLEIPMDAGRPLPFAVAVKVTK